MVLSCRFYSQQFPELEEVVMVTVTSVAEMGAYVKLLEYNDNQGMILLSELSRRRIRSINKLIRVGKTEPVVVIRVDNNKGYIDLSKRRVTPEDIQKCTERFARGKLVNSVLRHTADLLEYKTDEQLEELYQKTAWKFEEKNKEKASAYDFFKQAVTNPSILLECDLDEKTREVLNSVIQKKFLLQTKTLRADIHVACFGYEGIDAVKASLNAGLALSTPDFPIKIQLIASPNFVMTTQTIEEEEGLKVLNNAMDAIEAKINSYNGGEFKVVLAPKITTASDDAELEEKMDRAEAENDSLPGDNDEEVQSNDDEQEAKNDESAEEE